MTVSMHENILERRYEGLRDRPQPTKTERADSADSAPVERWLLLLKKRPWLAPVLDPHLRRRCLTAARALKAAAKCGDLSSDGIPAWLFDDLSALYDQKPATLEIATVVIKKSTVVLIKEYPSRSGKTLAVITNISELPAEACRWKLRLLDAP
jgi:hypothetical protein